MQANTQTSTQISTLFAVPVAQAQHPDPARLNDELARLFLERERDPKYRNPHPSMRIGAALYESDFNLFSWPEACIGELQAFCWSALSQLVAGLNGYPPEELGKIQIRSHTWFHITRDGGWFGLHNHAMASWSGVYCVTPGDVAGDPENGLLNFVNPLSTAGMFIDAGNVRVRRPYNLRNLGFQLRPGQLVLFPSWLNHEVLPYRGSGERITVAFNCWFEGAA